MSATPDAESDYLQPGFDANSLTIPKLRGILLAHDISYASNAKKGDLVDIFEKELVPQAKRILVARSRIKRSSRGIVDVASSAEPSIDGERSEEELDQPRPSRTPRRTARSTVSRATETESPERTSLAARSSRASSARLSLASGAESDSTVRNTPANTRRTRKSITTPAVKEEPEDETDWRREKESSVTGFSSENVFQQGSPQLNDIHTSGDEKRKRSSGALATTAKKPRSTSKRKIETTRILDNNDERDETNMPGEEFTPEESEDLALAQQDGTIDIPPRSRKTASRGGIIRAAPMAIMLGLLGGLATVWRQEKIAVGFCGIGQASTTLGGVEIPEWARDTIQPQCEPCPSHAYCYSDLRASCEEGFMLVPHPLSLGGIVPLPPTCEPDGERARKVKAVADRAVEELRQRNAKFECGELRDENGKKASSAEIKEDTLKAQVSNKRRKGMSQDEFEDLWHSALAELVDRDEIVSDIASSSIPAPHPHHTEASEALHSHISRSHVPSDDPSESRWQDILASLSLA